MSPETNGNANDWHCLVNVAGGPKSVRTAVTKGKASMDNCSWQGEPDLLPAD